jgi:hypothetical protein
MHEPDRNDTSEVTLLPRMAAVDVAASDGLPRE